MFETNIVKPHREIRAHILVKTNRTKVMESKNYETMVMCNFVSFACNCCCCCRWLQTLIYFFSIYYRGRRERRVEGRGGREGRGERGRERRGRGMREKEG